jgi:hypothetical protein
MEAETVPSGAGWLTADALVRWNVLQDHHPVLVATEAAT